MLHIATHFIDRHFSAHENFEPIFRATTQPPKPLNQLSNWVLDGVTVRYEIIKPLRTLSEMKTDSNLAEMILIIIKNEIYKQI